ncbi:HAD-IB family hydrolase [Clostridium sp. CX1]|uniref:HAD-IB family hydrolase n=1 Tax=Clostridium tanneri TaxID=3037988 RepID=A0ABU4JNN5_9CLOT|nr:MULTISPECIES: HAD-IB family hydrolase [unclassified Clostridium]MCT8976158.1 HAD-IB family hydrolase [Clostridium sp. CX1]MDW8799722.1 HAD-IB family hydrolase [Clostridium sp. A1-XYC3]
MDKLAIFDVDYTLTKRETLAEFYLFMIKKYPKLIVHAPRGVFSAFLYAIKVLDSQRAKENFIAFIDGVHEKDMQKIVEEFYEKRLSRIFYKDAMDTMKKLKSEGYKVYLISASAEFYLNELYKIKEVDKVIGTRFTQVGGKYSRKIAGKNCKGEEKVRRLMEVLKEENIEVDFNNSYMFSDSLADLPLFNLVGNPYLINYKKGHDKIKILNWK